MRTLDNLESVLSIEMMIACQAMEFIEETPSPVLKKVLDCVREVVEPLEKDRNLSPDIASIRRLIADGIIVKIVEEEIGDLMQWPSGTRDIV